jgi:polyisoprenoid-binding protein YceI
VSMEFRNLPTTRGYKAVIGGIALALAAVCARAQSHKITVHLDPATTEIHWTLPGSLHTTHGTFQLKGGEVVFDPANGEATGELLVDLASGESGDKSRDARMQSDVLESQKYPQALFHPSKVTGTVQPGTTQTITAEGTFNLHGTDHQLNLEIQVKVDGNRATAVTHFSVPYVAWGMKDPSSFILRVGKEVAIDVVAHGTIAGSPTK